MPIQRSQSLRPINGLDPDTNLWVAAVAANGGSVSAGRQTIVNNLIVGLKTDGIWTTKLDRLWFYAGENEPYALTDIVALTLATAVGSPTFTTDRGYTGNGSSAKIDSGFNPSTAGGNYSQNSAALFGWSTDSSHVDSNSVFGVATSSTFTVCQLAANIVWDINDLSFRNAIAAPSDESGLWTLIRDSSSTSAVYQNGSQMDTNNVASTGNPNANLVALTAWDGSFSNRQIACFGFGGGLTETEQGNLYTRIRTYMTAVGVP